MKFIKLFSFFAVFAVALTAMSQKQPPQNQKKIDDWEYNATMTINDGVVGKGRMMPTLGTTAMPSPMMKSLRVEAAPANLGFAVGGAKDANNFYDNLKNGYLPKLKSITYEGVFYEHYFDTGKEKEPCKTLFCPSYSTAVQKNLFTDETEHYLSVGLNSNIQVEDFARKKLNLVVVLDISGSMSSPFNRYYYDQRKEPSLPSKEEQKPKMEVANESLAAMLKHLKAEDSLGIVLFDSRAYLAKPLRQVAYTDMQAIEKHIPELKPRGGTNWSEGYKKGLSLFEKLDKAQKDPSVYENRIIFITDAMPNRGELNEKGLFGMVDKAAKEGIYTSFIGVGIDFNADLVERVSKTKGANYYAVHSVEEFKKRLDDEFDFMVTPLVFDLKVTLDTKGYEIEGIYGSPEADKATKTVLYVNTLFPSSSKDEKTKGGIILVKLKKISDTDNLTLTASYKDRNGKKHEVTKSASFKNGLYYDNSGIRKAILLSEYVTLIQNWLIDARAACNDKVTHTPKEISFYRKCMLYPPERPEYPMIETWERKSCKLRVSDGYRNVFALFKRKFATEMKILGDESLQKEYDALSLLTSGSFKNQNGKKDDWQTER